MPENPDDIAFFDEMPETGELVPISIRIEPEVLEWYRKSGRGWQTRMKDVLKAHMHEKDTAFDWFERK